MNNSFYQKMIYSKSKIAMILRLLAWGLLVLAVVFGVIESFRDAEPVPLLLYTANAAVGMLFLYTVAAIPHYLAEIADSLSRRSDEDSRNS